MGRRRSSGCSDCPCAAACARIVVVRERWFGAVLNIILTALHVVFSVGLIVTVLLMSGRSAGLSGAIAGGAETFFGKRKGLDEFLSRLAAGMAFAFLITSLILSFLSKRA